MERGDHYGAPSGQLPGLAAGGWPICLLCITASGILNAVYPYLTGTLLYDKVLGKDEAFLHALGIGGQAVVALGLLVVVMMGTSCSSRSPAYCTAA